MNLIMNTQLSLLTTILTHPEDDLPRQVYADWLEENGDPERSAFIRVQCELAKLPEGHFVAVEGCPMSGGGPNYFVAPGETRLRIGVLYELPVGSRVDLPRQRRAFNQKNYYGLRVSKHINEFDVVLVEDDLSKPEQQKELRRRERKLFKAGLCRWMFGNVTPNAAYRILGEQDIERGSLTLFFSRGFISHVTCSWADWQAHADQLTWWLAKPCPACIDKTGFCWGKVADCHTCRGKGEIPGATMPCPCVVGGLAMKIDCCSGSGRIPRPVTLAMQPITEVTLSTWPQHPIESMLRKRFPNVKKWNLPEVRYEAVMDPRTRPLHGPPLPIQHSGVSLPMVVPTGFLHDPV